MLTVEYLFLFFQCILLCKKLMILMFLFYYTPYGRGHVGLAKFSKNLLWLWCIYTFFLLIFSFLIYCLFIFFLRIGLLHFQARCHKRRLKLG